MLRHVFAVTAQLLAVSAVPQLLSCGDDAGTMMQRGQTIMGQPVGSNGDGGMRIIYDGTYLAHTCDHAAQSHAEQAAHPRGLDGRTGVFLHSSCTPSGA